MQVLRPGELTLDEHKVLEWEDDERLANLQISDEQLREYVQLYFSFYRETLERYFPTLAPHLSVYALQPFDSYILRLGQHGIIMGHRPAEGQGAAIRVMRPEDFDPPLTTINLFDVLERWGTPDFASFDLRGRTYDKEDAEFEGVRRAFADARHVFWAVHQPDQLRRISIELLKAEGFTLEEGKKGTRKNKQADVFGNLIMDEPARYRRIERWAFKIYHETERVTPATIQEAEAYISKHRNDIDVLCLITSGDLTSIGNYVASKHSRIRIWDRSVLDALMTEHLEVVAPYFPSYADAVKVVEGQWALRGAGQTSQSRLEEFEERLQACPPGQLDFRTYEEIGKEIWEYLFTPEALGPGKEQPTTSDKKQRRDVLFRNQRTRRFWQRVFEKHDADFIIVDFKNYTDPVGPDVIDSVQKYGSKALGWFIVVVSRQGAAPAFDDAQIRQFKDSPAGLVVLVVSDNQMLEMVRRKESGDAPEDVIEDIYEQFMLRC